jgi:hypothetical protein
MNTTNEKAAVSKGININSSIFYNNTCSPEGEIRGFWTQKLSSQAKRVYLPGTKKYSFDNILLKSLPKPYHTPIFYTEIAIKETKIY